MYPRLGTSIIEKWKPCEGYQEWMTISIVKHDSHRWYTLVQVAWLLIKLITVYIVFQIMIHLLKWLFFLWTADGQTGHNSCTAGRRVQSIFLELFLLIFAVCLTRIELWAECFDTVRCKMYDRRYLQLSQILVIYVAMFTTHLLYFTSCSLLKYFILLTK